MKSYQPTTNLKLLSRSELVRCLDCEQCVWPDRFPAGPENKPQPGFMKADGKRGRSLGNSRTRVIQTESSSPIRQKATMPQPGRRRLLWHSGQTALLGAMFRSGGQPPCRSTDCDFIL